MVKKSTSADLKSSITWYISSLLSPKPTIKPDLVKIKGKFFLISLSSFKLIKYLEPGLIVGYNLGTVSKL